MANITTDKQINDTQDLKNLSDRLQQRAFSWQHEDYFLLKRMLPGLITSQGVDFPILKILDSYLQAGATIEMRDNLVCLIRADGTILGRGDTLQKLLTELIFILC